ncbi:MAG: protein phosphatase 2C domain-containing protein [Bacilli bacterium]|jgi:protein phosphatase
MQKENKSLLLKEKIACLSDKGNKRLNNEDAAYVASCQYGALLVVADGMGGHRKGEVASKIVVDSLALSFASTRHEFSFLSAKRFVNKALKKANKEIYKMSLEGEFKEMGTTAVSALKTKNGVLVTAVGDSRCYTYSKKDGLVLRTTDQTYVELLFEAGKINRNDIKTHPQRNLLVNAVGINPDLSQVEETSILDEDYDVLLLCSDGLYNMVDDQGIISTLKNDSLSSDSKCRELISKALAGGGNDNVAVAVLEKP